MFKSMTFVAQDEPMQEEHGQKGVAAQRWRVVNQSVEAGNDPVMVSAAEVASVSGATLRSSVVGVPSLAPRDTTTDPGTDDDVDGEIAQSRGSEASSISAISKSKPAQKRNKKHRDKAREKTMQHLRAKAEREGREFHEWVDVKEWREQRRGGLTSEQMKEMVEAMNKIKLSTEDRGIRQHTP